MSYASWVVRRSIKGLEVVEVVAEKDMLRCQKKIDALNDRMAVDQAMITFARDTRIAMSHYVIEISDIEEEQREKVAKAGTRLVEALPPKPRVKGFFRRRLIASPVTPGTTTQQHATV